MSEDILSKWLERNALEQGEHPAIFSGDEKISYIALNDRVRRLAGGLQSLGVGKGDVVAVQLPNTPEFIITYLAITSLGAITQTLHMPYRESELEYFLEDSGAKGIVCLARFKDYSPAASIIKISQEKQHDLFVVALGQGIEGGIAYDELAEHEAPDKETQLKESDQFILLYTSGTTSRPKGVPHRYGSFLGNARACAKEYGFSRSDRLLSLAPMSHLYGLFVCNMTLSLGATSVLLAQFTPADFVDTVRTAKPTAIFAAPAHFAACFHAGLLQPQDFESVKFVCLSGSTVLPSLAQQVDDLLVNGKVGQLWGMSELQAGAITRLNDEKTVRYYTAGRATPGTELRVAGDDGKALAANHEGELQVKGVSVFQAYLNKPDETEKVFTEDGWFRSGDLARLDEEGNLSITGRVKHVINRGGVKYNPIEIEQIVAEIDGVNNCAVVPVPDPVLGEKACLFVVKQSGKEMSLDEINRFLEIKNIAKYKWPERLEFVDSMPLTPTNKVIHAELLKRIQ